MLFALLAAIEKLKHVLLLFIVLVLSTLLAYLWGAFSVEIVDTGLWQLEKSYQGIYVQSVADAYAADSNKALAIERLSFLCQQSGGLETAFTEAQQRYGQFDPTRQRNLDRLHELIDTGEVQEDSRVMVCNTRPINRFASVARLAGPVLIVLMGVLIVGSGVMAMIRTGEEEAVAAPRPKPAAPVAPPTERAKPTLPGIGRRKPPSVQETARSAAARGAQISATVEKTDFIEEGLEPPTVQFMTTYLHGDDLYDDSFSIETPSGEFLGETGVGISDTIGAGGEAKRVTAFEVWLFDKNDIRTVTKVLMSDHAYNDDAIRAKLAPKGEAVLIKAGDRMTLETASLRVQARVVDLSYGSGGGAPPNSFFDRITIELAAWKRGDKSGRPAGSSPASTPPVGTPPPPNS